MFIDIVRIPVPVKGQQESYDALQSIIKNKLCGFIYEPFQGAAGMVMYGQNH
jgi:adenosylmethionine-8-amino-7-oxononanoate aminotransferase